MKKLFLKFLTSKFSGWISLLALSAVMGLGTYISKQIYDYKELQRRAAFCDGQLSALDNARAYQDEIIRRMERESAETLDEITQLKELPGCASELADNPILDGLRDK